jgi:peptide deformylase
MAAKRRLPATEAAAWHWRRSPRVDRRRPGPYLSGMKLLDIITIPDRTLREKSAAVERIDDELHRFLDRMLETMYAAPGIGLAAVQVGVPRRVITIDIAARENEDGSEGNHEPVDPARDPLFLINPEIVWRSDEPSIYEEGCLSIPEYYAEVERPSRVRFRYLDRHGKPHEQEAEGLLATVVQHEVDHLNGKLFIDHISKLKRDMVIKKFTKASKQGTKPAL